MITLIIPTHNRPHFLKRLLIYYRELNFPHPIIIADSSSAPDCDKNHSVVKSLQDVLNISYKLKSPDINFYLKIAQALNAVDSKYAVICADDDFLVPKSIEQCASFLDANPDYSIAHGRAARIDLSQSSENHDAHHASYIYPYPQCNIEFNNPRLRLQKHLMDYTATFYSVHRCSDLKRNMQLSFDNSFDNRFGEVLPSCLSLIQGKAKRLDKLYMARQVHRDSTTGERLSWPVLLTLDDFSKRYVRFRNCLAEELINFMDLPMTEAKNVVNYAFLSYMARALYRSNIGQFTWRTNDVFNQAMQHIRKGIKILPAAARAAVFKGQLIAMSCSPRKAYRKLQFEKELPVMNTRSNFHSDFMTIYKNVMRYPNGCDTFT